MYRLLVYPTFGSLCRPPIGVAVIFRCVSVTIEIVSQAAIKLLPLSGVLHILDSWMHEEESKRTRN